MEEHRVNLSIPFNLITFFRRSKGPEWVKARAQQEKKKEEKEKASIALLFSVLWLAGSILILTKKGFFFTQLPCWVEGGNKGKKKRKGPWPCCNIPVGKLGNVIEVENTGSESVFTRPGFTLAVLLCETSRGGPPQLNESGNLWWLLDYWMDRQAMEEEEKEEEEDTNDDGWFIIRWKPRHIYALASASVFCTLYYLGEWLILTFSCPFFFSFFEASVWRAVGSYTLY